MKNKWVLFASIFQLVVGLLAIATFAVLSFGGENTVKWIITLILAVLFVISGILGILNYTSNK